MNYNKDLYRNFENRAFDSYTGGMPPSPPVKKLRVSWPVSNLGWARYYAKRSGWEAEQLMWQYLIFAAFHGELDES